MTLREARELRRLEQVDLMAKTKQIDRDGLGVDQSSISKIERGVVTDPSNSTVVLLEKALRVRRGTLVFGVHAEASR